MVKFNFTYDLGVSLEQRIGFQLAAEIWSKYLTDDVEINLHIGSSDQLGENGNAVGGAVPIFHEQTYGIYKMYAEADAATSESSAEPTVDEQALDSLQIGNTVDLLQNGQLVTGNTNVLLTSAQAKALGMEEELALNGDATWDRDLVNADGLDGYIVVSQRFDWSYDFTRQDAAAEGSLDFLSMAMHEIGHQLGFVSGIDGTLDTMQLHSGETRLEDFTVLDLFRHTIQSAATENVDGALSDLSVGQNAYFSIHGGETNLANFSTGENEQQGGDGFQASHWERMQNALGIMDPTLAYQERLSLSMLDLQAMDVLGWDIDYSMSGVELDLEALLHQAEVTVAQDLGLDSSLLSQGNGDGQLYQMGYNQWWQIFEKQMLEMAITSGGSCSRWATTNGGSNTKTQMRSTKWAITSGGKPSKRKS